jgi:hypothetical protein
MTMPIERSTGNPLQDGKNMNTDDGDKTVQSKGSGTKNNKRLAEFLMKVSIRPKDRKTQLTQTEVLTIHRALCTALLNVPGTVIIIDNSKEEHETAKSSS